MGTPAHATDDDLDLALALADEADALTMQRFGAIDLRVQTKPDMTPATDADLDAEKLLRRRLSEHRPADSVFGEEFGGQRDLSGRQWVIDPIDGTKNFVRGVPVWATLIALLDEGTPIVGVVSAPALGRRWWAAAGRGAHTSFGGRTRPITVSAVADLDAASLSYSDLTTGWDAARTRFVALTDAVWRVRGYGDFWSYCLVAEGAVDIAVEPEVKLWDLAPLDILVREAGGRFTDLADRPGPHGGSAVATNGLLHDAVLAALRL
ncbi:histidinol-phosphatase [Mycolicibacterium duvalii]|uniref:Histidinol-phosphatase n=1 Tax=Mycolicibacterium duvalii TaxID=39688 RepID=A0A7I7K2N3_9MYCO|nr:histidinol-phosphatase [Mycolicibacterium duvalii]MCV7366638.1 histidinol-phosphatase [Mycolicibacterium duvalii]PEG41578.1 histidinol-phosphatase [Mycolicibacterium duvalii]BBX17749.1 histidinol-phosphatase [Mycolicibacterium duvalii]